MKSFFQFINEGKNIGPLYHFTSLEDAMSIIEIERLYSTQGTWSLPNKGYYSPKKKYTGQISFTRNKLLYQDKPKGVSFGVRFVFDGNKLSNDFRIRPVKFSTIWEESEDAVFTIGSWGKRKDLKRHQIFDIKKYIISIDLMPFDIYKESLSGYDIDRIEKLGISIDDSDLTEYSKPKRSLVNKIKLFLEEKGYPTRLVHEKFNKRVYQSDRKVIGSI